MSDAQDEPAAGGCYGKPPVATQFKKGLSGNPRGRPRNRRREIPYDTVLGQMVTIREDGRERRVTAAEAFLLQLTRKGLQGDNSAARASLQAIEAARAKVPSYQSEPLVLRIVFVSMGVGIVLDRLGIAYKRFSLDEKRVRWQLKPWIVEAALARLGKHQLTTEEQSEVWNAADKPASVNWPDWWTERG